MLDTPAVMITGARQVGKTTLAKTVNDAAYFTFDDLELRAIVKSAPTEFIKGIAGRVILDEIQHLPEILSAIKQSIDNDRSPGRYILTGSANILTLPKISESLAGRVELLNLRTLSRNEIVGTTTNVIDRLFADDFPIPSDFDPIGKRELVEIALTGGYPEAVARKTQERRRIWFNSYITTIVQRDVRDLARIEGLVDIPRLLGLLAARTGNLMSVADLSRSLGYSQATLHRYLVLLEQVFLIENLPAWSGNLSSRLIKAAKTFFADCGLAGYLVGADTDRVLSNATSAGGIIENFVIAELRKHLEWSQTSGRAFHFRNSSNTEVDIVLESTLGEIVGIEVKFGSDLGKSDFRGLKRLAEDVGSKFKRGVILHAGDKFAAFGNELYVAPISLLWR